MNANTEIATLTPIKPDTPNMGEGRDEAYKDGFNITHLENLVSDCDNQPAWRERSDIAAAYVDGKQTTEEQERALLAEGMPDVKPTNLVGRVVRGILGQEAKARTDVRVEADNDEDADICEVYSMSMKEAMRETYSDMAVSNAYAGQVAPGVGWVEVARNSDLLDYPYRVADVHRSEMWWDWKAKDYLLRDARWLARKRWQDLDELEAAMPQFREILRGMANDWQGFNWDILRDDEVLMGSATQAFNIQNRWNRYHRRSDWYDSARRRVKLYEIWYKMPAIAVVMQISPTRFTLLDPTNPTHAMAVQSGRVKLKKTLTKQVRMSLYAGPHRLQDFGTRRRNYPYIPFMAYRDDEDMTPYGLVEGMIGPQDEYNSRRFRINWLLRARQLQMDGDALDLKANTLADILATMNRPDFVAVLNPNRANKSESAFRVGNTLTLQKEQVDVMQDAKQLVQDVPGVYGSQLGQASSGVTSGIANSLLIEQGAVAMGDLNDNYRYSRRMVYENLLDLIIEDHSNADLAVAIGQGSSRRTVVLNQWDPEKQVMMNNTRDAAVRVGLGEVPTTPAYRMQQQEQIAKIIAALSQANPQAVAVVVPAFIEATDLPNRMELADDVRRASGLPTAGDKQQQQAQQQAQAQEAAEAKKLQQQAIQLQLQQKEADVRKTTAEVEETQTKSQLNLAKVADIGHAMGLNSAAANAPPAEPDPVDPTEQMINESLAEALQPRAA